MGPTWGAFCQITLTSYYYYLYCRLADDGGGRGNVVHHVKREGDCPGGGMPGGIYPVENVRIPDWQTVHIRRSSAFVFVILFVASTKAEVVWRYRFFCRSLCMQPHAKSYAWIYIFLTKICLGPGDFILAVIRTDLHCHLEVTVAQQGRFGTKSTVSHKLCILTINNNSNHLQLTRKKTSNYSHDADKRLNLMSKRSVLIILYYITVT